MDREVLRDIWHGQLPLCFKLHPDDVSGMHRPEPYYMMVPRVSYFPLVLDRVVKYFNRFIDQNKQAVNDMWLDYEGQPIKWQHPIGLSWDLFGSDYDLPWRLILHFSEFPVKELVRCNTKSSIETCFMSAIKEADALKHKGSVIKNMVKKDHNQLWSSLVNEKFDQFWLINQRLMERLDNELFRYIPFRLHMPDYTYVQKAVRPCTTDKQIFQIDTPNQDNRSSPQHHQQKQRIPIVYDADLSLNNKSHKCNHSPEGHRCSTLLDLIKICFSNRMHDLLINRPNTASPWGIGEDIDKEGETAVGEECESEQADMDQDADDQESESARNATTKPFRAVDETAGDGSTNELIDVSQFKYRFLAHGIEIPFDTPLQWLSEHFSYPDNFLHICAVIKENLAC